MLNRTLKSKVVGCQEINANKPNLNELGKEFLKQTTDFVKNVVELENSPWRKGHILKWVRIENNIRIGAKQEALLELLNNRYFHNNQPCFVKYDYLCKTIGIKSHRQLREIIQKLEQQNVLFRIKWLYKDRRDRMMILPMIPSLNSLINERQLPKQDQYLSILNQNLPLFHSANKGNFLTYKDLESFYNHCKTPPSTPPTPEFLPCKLLNSLTNVGSLILYTNILYINKLFNNNKVTINQLKDNTNVLTERNAHPGSPTCAVRLLTKSGLGKSMIERYRLKVKSFDSKPDFIVSLKQDRFDYDRINQQSRLNEYCQFKYGIDLGYGGPFTINPNSRNGKFDKRYDVQRDVRAYMLRMMYHGDPLQWEFADRFIEKWNETVDKVYKINGRKKPIKKCTFPKDKPNKTYDRAVIAISHCLIHNAKRDTMKMYRFIDRVLHAIKLKQYPFKSYSKTQKGIEDMLTDAGNKRLKEFFAPDLEWDAYVYDNKPVPKKHETRIKEGMEAFKTQYCNYFCIDNKQKGIDHCTQYTGMIKKWILRRIDEIRQENRNMCGYSLLFDNGERNGHILPPLIALMFEYLNDKYNFFNLVHLLNDKYWKEFVKVRMRIIERHHDFYEINKYRKDKK